MAKYSDDFERNQAEKYAENYWKKNGFDYRVKRKSMSKCVYIVNKDGIEFPYTIVCDVTDRRMYMKSFAEQFEMRKKIKELEEQKQ